LNTDWRGMGTFALALWTCCRLERSI